VFFKEFFLKKNNLIEKKKKKSLVKKKRLRFYKNIKYFNIFNSVISYVKRNAETNKFLSKKFSNTKFLSNQSMSRSRLVLFTINNLHNNLNLMDNLDKKLLTTNYSQLYYEKSNTDKPILTLINHDLSVDLAFLIILLV